MTTRATGRVRPAATILFAVVTPVLLAAGLAPGAAAQTALSSGVCDGRVGVPVHYSFNQSGIPYWAVVGVTPDPADDKDIYLYSGPLQTGDLLASSNGVSGADFVIADFNHTPYGTYYPTVTYGSTTALYVVEWSQGGNILPLNQTMGVPVSAAGSGTCFAFSVWDVLLEAGATYRILSYSTTNPTAILLFRNPGTGAYFAGRSQAVVDLVGDGVYADYTAPETDWYGLVVAQNARVSNSGWADFEVRKLDSCEPLADANCVSATPYDVVTGPADSHSFEQASNWWAAVAAAPSSGDEKSLRIRSQCDYTATDTPIAESTPAVGETQLLVGDFNHATLPTTLFADVDGGDPYAQYTIEWEDGNDVFYMNSALSGSVGGVSGDCNLVKMWDIFIEGGKTYQAWFSRLSGNADLRLRLFRNPSSGAYFADESMAEWKVNTTGWTYGPLPTTDWYGLAVYANKGGESGTYELSFEEVNDCDEIPHMACIESQGNAKDFHMGALSNSYWLAVGVLPSDGDDKDISVYSTCDGGDPLLGESVGVDGADFVVADFNHPPMPSPTPSMDPTANNWYPRVTYGSTTAPYSVSCDLGNVPAEDVFPHDVMVQGVVAGPAGDCGMLKIWDIYLFENEQYHFGFTRGGDTDVRLALIRNPSNYRMWIARGSAEWELDHTQDHAYTAPASDYYGLVVFANRRGEFGSYTIRVSSGATGVEDDAPAPDTYALYQNEPNPFNPTTRIRYDVPESGGAVQLRIYGVDGRLVRTLVDGIEPAGQRSITWDGRDYDGARVATGVYFYRLDAPGFRETRKMVVVK
jgi:hypothetical protein